MKKVQLCGNRIALSELIMYLWIISISMGLIYNSFGQKVVLAIFILMIIAMGKNKIDSQLLFWIAIFSIFILIKTIGVNIVVEDDYHSLWKVYYTIFNVMVSLICINMLVKEKSINERVINKGIRLFNILFYTTLIITIIMLAINGRGLYRKNVTISPIYAPQFFLIYSIVLSYVLVYMIFSSKKNRWKNIFKLCVNALFVFMMNYTTQMVFFVFAVCLAWLVTADTIVKKRNRLFIIVIALILIIPNLSTLITYINEKWFYNNLDVNMRLTEVSRFLKNGDLSGIAFGGRLRVMQISLNSFLENPFFGVSFTEYNMGEFSSIGGHHEWIDDLARYGLIGFVIYMFVLFNGLKVIFIKNTRYRALGVGLLAVFVLYGLFNPILDEYSIIALLLSYIGVTYGDYAREQVDLRMTNVSSDKLYKELFSGY